MEIVSSTINLSNTQKSSSKSNNFNIIRFIAAFMVIYGHMSSIMGLPAQTVLAQRVSTIGVKTIFVISGYLITKSFLSDSHYGRFMVRRCLRIFPPLILLIFLTTFVMGPIMTELPIKEYYSNYGTRFYLRNILLFPVYALPGVFTQCPYPNAVNGSLWTLPIEFALYLLLPCVIIVLRKLNVLRSGLGIVAVLALVGSILKTVAFPYGRLVFYGTNWPDAMSLLPYYFAGAFFSLPEMKKYLNIQVSVFMVGIAALCSTNVALNELAVGIALPYFVLSFGLVQDPVFSKFFEKADFSYGIYLYGFPIQQMLYQFLSNMQLGVLTMSIISFCVSILLAVGSWFIIERHMQKLSKKIIQYWRMRSIST